MDLDQFMDNWRFKFDEEPPSWVRHMDDPESELEECQSRMQSLMHSLRKEEYLQMYLRQQVRAVSRRSMFSDTEKIEEEAESIVSDDTSTEHVDTSTMTGSVENLDEDRTRSPSADNDSQCSSIVELARVIVESAIAEASKNCSDKYFRDELLNVMSISEGPSQEDSHPIEEEINESLPLQDQESKNEGVPHPSTELEPPEDTLPEFPKEPPTDITSCDRPDSKSSGEVAAAFRQLDDMLANVSPLVSPEPLNSPRQLHSQQQLVAEHHQEAFKRLQQQQQQQGLEQQHEQQQQEKPQQQAEYQQQQPEQQLEEKLQQQERAENEQQQNPSKQNDSVVIIEETHPDGHPHTHHNGFTPTVLWEIGNGEPVTPSELTNGSNMSVLRSPRRNSPRMQSKKRANHSSTSPLSSIKRPSSAGMMKRGTSSRPGSGRRSMQMYRVLSGSELDDISLSFDDVDEGDSDDPDLEHAVLSNLSEPASAFYSFLGSSSVHSLDDLDDDPSGLQFANSTGNLLSEGDYVMKEYWEHSNQVRRRRKSTQSSSTAPDEDQEGSNKRPSRVSAVFRTTVLEGETLVMRKLVVSGIVAAEKTYLTWLTILKENYRSPLLAVADSSHPILEDKNVRTIFYGVEELQELHSKLYKQFEARAQNWSSDVCVGDLFIELCKNLKHYRDYVEMSQKSLLQLKKSKNEVASFKKFLEDAREVVMKSIQDCPSVEDLLRKPVERLQSYSLVLNDLCQHTPEDHPDYRILRESLKAMSDFIASTHDPSSFKELSSSYNRQLMKESLMVELVDGMRKVRSLLLFQDILVCAKQKHSRDTIKLELKWYIPLSELMFTPLPDANASRQPVKATSDAQLEQLKSKIAEVKAQMRGEKGSTDTLSTGSLGKRKGRTATKEAKYAKKLNELLAQYWMAQPSLPLRIFTKSGKNYVFVVHNEDIREAWITAIKKLQPKAGKVTVTPLELQDLLSKQKLQSRKDITDLPTGDHEQDYLSGVLRVVVKEARDLKLKPNVYCALEVDEYGRFYRKARTSFGTTSNETDIKWDEGFEIDLSGSRKMKVLVCVKQLLKEEVISKGSCVLPTQDLRRGRRVKTTIKLHPIGVAELSVQYYQSHEAMVHKPALASSGVFGYRLDEVIQKENHDIPLLVETCVHEIERRGLNEVGIYRVAGVMRDVDELRRAFDTDYFKAQALAADIDIHAVAGLLKKYFRELPEPLFTTMYYTSFIQGYSLQDPDARDQSLISLFHSLPLSYYKTAVYLLEHLKTVAQHSSENKMTLLNLATLFGPNLIRPGLRAGQELEATLDVMSQVGVLMYFLNIPSEMYDLIEWQRTSPSTLREILHGSGKKKLSSVGVAQGTSRSGNR